MSELIEIEILEVLNEIKGNTKKQVSWVTATLVGVFLAIIVMLFTRLNIPPFSKYFKAIEDQEVVYSKIAATWIAKNIASEASSFNSQYERERIKLDKVHPDLVDIFKMAQANTKFEILIREGKRTINLQKIYFKSGASKTMNSRHLIKKGMVHALDLYVKYDGQHSNKKDWKWCRKINDAMQEAAKQKGIKLEWGGNWKPGDGFHHQLTWKDYPATHWYSGIKNKFKRKKKNKYKISNAQWASYKNIIGCHESRHEKTFKKCMAGKYKGSYSAENKYGYVGKFQMGASSLCEAGLIIKSACIKMYKCSSSPSNSCKKWKLIANGTRQKQFLKNKNNWRNGSFEQFKSSPETQEMALKNYTMKNIKYGGKIITSTVIALRYAAGAHLVGHSKTRRYLSGGKDYADGNGTRVSYYINSIPNGGI